MADQRTRRPVTGTWESANREASWNRRDDLEASPIRSAGAPQRLVILESPYAGCGTLEENIAYARACVRDSIMRGEAPIASHLLHTQPGILDDTNREERAMGIAAGLAWLRVADYSVFYVDRGISAGMLYGYEAALKLKKMVGVRRIGKGSTWYKPGEEIQWDSYKL